MVPSFPDSVYYGQWTPLHRNLEPYGGKVIDASIGDIALPSRQLMASDSIRHLLRQGTPLTLLATVGPPGQSLASIFSIADDQWRQILLIGADRNDLVFHYRTQAVSVRLDQPEVRLAGRLSGLTPGDTLRIAVRGADPGYCIAVNELDRCRLGFDLGAGWSLLYTLDDLPEGLRRVLNAAWIGLLLFPFGYWSRSHAASIAGGVLIVLGLAAVPLLTGLLPTPASAWLGAIIGAGTAWVIRISLANRRRGTIRPPEVRPG